jgi:hypothetical protein
MTMSWAWKDLWSEVLKEKESLLDKLMTNIGSENLEKTKGFVSAVNWIEGHIGYVLNGIKK